jgi:hypothetical protein
VDQVTVTALVASAGRSAVAVLLAETKLRSAVISALRLDAGGVGVGIGLGLGAASVAPPPQPVNKSALPNTKSRRVGFISSPCLDCFPNCYSLPEVR